jgi:hypothetical protein
MASDETPFLTVDLGLSYLNEGAANIVYRFSKRQSTPEPSLIEEYGVGTPPPSEIESEISLDGENLEKYFHTFDSKYRPRILILPCLQSTPPTLFWPPSHTPLAVL